MTFHVGSPVAITASYRARLGLIASLIASRAWRVSAKLWCASACMARQLATDTLVSNSETDTTERHGTGSVAGSIAPTGPVPSSANAGAHNKVIRLAAKSRCMGVLLDSWIHRGASAVRVI